VLLAGARSGAAGAGRLGRPAGGLLVAGYLGYLVVVWR